MADDDTVSNAMRTAGAPRNALVEALLGARNAIPENTEHSLSLANMLRGGLGSAAGWMDWRNKLNPDDYAPQEVLAPPGLGFLRGAGSRSLPASASAHEWPTHAALKIADEIYTGPSHYAAFEAAEKRHGDNVFNLLKPGGEGDGFITNTGRFVGRDDALQLARRSQRMKGKAHDAIGFDSVNLEPIPNDPRMGRHNWKESVEDPTFRRLMGQEYAKAKAGDDYSTMYDILGARLYRDQGMPPAMRQVMELELEHIKHVLGPEWMAKYGPRE